MKKIYTKYLTLAAFLMLLSVVASGQKKIMVMGRGADMATTTYASDVDIMDSLAAWEYAPDYFGPADYSAMTPLYGSYDGIFICESVNSGDITFIGATDNYALPIVSLEGYAPRQGRWNWLADNTTDFFQVASAGGVVEDNFIVIKDNSHYITKNFNVDDEVPWTTAEGYDQTDIRPCSFKEVNTAYTSKLAVIKADAAQTGFWNMVAVDKPTLPNKVFMWGIVHVGLDGGDGGNLHIGTKEFWNLLKRGCDWTFDNMEEPPTTVRDLRAGAFALTAWPNPSSGLMQVRFEAPRAGRAVATMYSMTGQRVAVFNRDAVAGSNNIELRAGDYAAGVYHLALEMDGRTEYLKVILH